jgi:hypothetical protein
MRVSDTPQLCDSTIGASEYWIARFRGRRRLRVWRAALRHRPETVIARAAKQSMLAAQKKEWIASLRSQ